jgi:hypothetical protein
MSEYKVTWVIDVDARSPKAAARKALAIQRDPNSSATVFDVAYHKVTKTKSGKVRSAYKHDRIDLLNLK